MSYHAVVLADNPLHFWRLADPVGSVCFDLGSSPFDLTSSNQFGQQGYSGASSDGGSTMFQPNNGAQMWGKKTFTSPLSMEIVVWPLQDPIAGAEHPFAFDETAGQPNFRLQYNNTTAWGFNNTAAAATSAGLYAPHHWTHLVGTYDEVHMKLYVNGALDGSSPLAVHYNFTSDIWVGCNPAFVGVAPRMLFAEAAVYNYALTAAQVGAHYAQLDQLLIRPFSLIGSGFSSVVGGGVPNTTQLQQILDSVRKVY